MPIICKSTFFSNRDYSCQFLYFHGYHRVFFYFLLFASIFIFLENSGLSYRMPPYCIKPDCSIAARFPQSAHETDFVGLTRRSPHRITLRVCGCGSLPAHETDFVGLTRRSPHRITLRVCGCGSLPAHETDFVGLTRRSPHRITLRVCGCGSLPAHETDFVGLTRRSPHRITLRVCGCGSLPAHIRILAMLSHRSMLIHVCVDHAYSFLCMLRMPKNCLRVDGLIQ